MAPAAARFSKPSQGPGSIIFPIAAQLVNTEPTMINISKFVKRFIGSFKDTPNKGVPRALRLCLGMKINKRELVHSLLPMVVP